jgi:hypothetical protein
LAFVSLVSVVACNSHEPSAAQFEQHQPAFEALRVMWESDVKAMGLVEVSVKDDKSFWCGGDFREKCLGVNRWKAYADVMGRIGVQWIRRESAPERTYFMRYARNYLTNARFRGVVHSTAAPAEIGSAAQREQWKRIKGDWYSCVLVD